MPPLQGEVAEPLAARPEGCDRGRKPLSHRHRWRRQLPFQGSHVPSPLVGAVHERPACDSRIPRAIRESPLRCGTHLSRPPYVIANQCSHWCGNPHPRLRPCHCEPARRLVWQSASPSPQNSKLKEERIATTVCALSRNDRASLCALRARLVSRPLKTQISKLKTEEEQ